MSSYPAMRVLMLEHSIAIAEDPDEPDRGPPMIISAQPGEIDAILGAMEAVAESGGPDGVTDVDRLTISAAGRILFGLEESRATRAFEPRAPGELAAALGSEDTAGVACRVLAVMSMVDGELDTAKIALLEEYAHALGRDDTYLGVLTEAVQGEMEQAAACMIRKNIHSFPKLDQVSTDFGEVMLPYRGDRADPELAARYESLGGLPDGTFGRAFFEHFRRNSFAFPGDPGGLSEGFTTPHDSSHVIAGYSTSQAGEICVSTFIGAMHPDYPMAAEVVPVLFSWHLGIQLTPVAGSFRGAYEPRRFWTAWDRGTQASVDLLDPGWDFWGVTDVPLAELRDQYAVPPVDPDLAP